MEKGIVGRGVLIDYHAWRLQQVEQGSQGHKEFDAFATMPIPLADLKACLEAQGTELRFGDILIIRSGEWTLLPARQFRSE